MRINKFVALATGMSRRAADKLLSDGRVTVNNEPAQLGQIVAESDEVKLGGRQISLPETSTTIIFNKPAGYVVSRDGQGSRTVYDLLPAEFHQLKPVGRLDKDSSGLLLLTSDGELANQLTHPRFAKEKVYELVLNKPLAPQDQGKIEQGIKLTDGPSKLQLAGNGKNWTVKMSEGRNRQIRRTFAALNYQIVQLHRTNFGDYKLDDLPPGKFKKID